MSSASTRSRPLLPEKLTVQTKPRVEIGNEVEKDNASIALCFFKWMCTFLLFCTILFCLVLSKVTLISIGHKLEPKIKDSCKIKPTTTTTPGKKASGWWRKTTTPAPVKVGLLSSPDADPDVAYTMILLIIMIPQMISFVRAFCKSAFSKIQLWPGRMSLFVGILAAIFETTGLCLFAFIVIPYIQNAAHAICLMNAILFLPIILQMIKEMCKHCCVQNRAELPQDENVEMQDINHSTDQEEEEGLVTSEDENRAWSKKPVIIFTICAVFSGVGLGYYLYSVYKKKTDCWKDLPLIAIPVSIVLLSISWCPQLAKFQSLPGLIDTTDEKNDTKLTIRSARHRMTLISSSIKLILTVIIAFFLGMAQVTKSDSKYPLLKGFNKLLDNPQLNKLFIMQVLASLIGYLATWTACKINLQKACFVFPYILATPVAVVVMMKPVGLCDTLFDAATCVGDTTDDELYKTIPFCVLLWVSSWAIIFQFFKSQEFLMAKEEVIFWLPTYDGVLLEQHILLNRKNEYTDEKYINYQQIVKDSRIYICTTMYHEADYEMEQLLSSIAEVDEVNQESKRKMEAHIFFDDGARDTVHVDPTDARMLETPYGLQLSFVLRHGMKLVIHLKDNVKVKNKKRWSQVMYMSYILDYKGKTDKVPDELSYILATDADVRFSHTDVMALMDFMSRDPNIAAVCGRTHPMGSGPIVWYQIFDYAIGHWLQKVANDILGTVLCSPGCFSVYRASAIRDVLPLYASGVNSPMDFLMKDMGEDRWFCTLLIEAGWKIEYCATSADSTYCPDTFEEFFKQRRRWGPSTFANQVEVLNKQKKIRENNDAINIMFMFYQMFLLVSSTVGPSSIILFMSAGLKFAFPDNIQMGVTLVFFILITLGFTFVCMYCQPDTQLKAAKILTYFFCIIMAVTAVGCLKQVSEDISRVIKVSSINLTATTQPLIDVTDKIRTTIAPKVPTHPPTTTPQTTIDPDLLPVPHIFQITTWFAFLFIGVFILTGILHGSEVLSLVYGVLYWLCLPSGHLLLTIYSIANLTDRSWGTREDKQKTYQDNRTWKEYISSYFRYICRCCIPPEYREDNIVVYSEPPSETTDDYEDAFDVDDNDRENESFGTTLDANKFKGKTGSPEYRDDNIVVYSEPPSETTDDYEDAFDVDDDDGGNESFDTTLDANKFKGKTGSPEDTTDGYTQEEQIYAMPENSPQTIPSRPLSSAFRQGPAFVPPIANRPPIYPPVPKNKPKLIRKASPYAMMDFGFKQTLKAHSVFRQPRRNDSGVHNAARLQQRRQQPIYHRFQSLQGSSTPNDTVSVEEVLGEKYAKYAKNFHEFGYDNASFIAGFVKEKGFFIKFDLTRKDVMD